MSAYSPLRQLIATGTKLWLDSIDPDLIEQGQLWGISGATSNPIIVASLLRNPRWQPEIKSFLNQMDANQQSDAEEITWLLTDYFVTKAQKYFLPIWEQTLGDDGYVSFEVDPLIDASDSTLSLSQKCEAYIREAKKWGLNRFNRMIKIPATQAGIAALPEVVRWGIPVNVTLIFSERQYREARDAVWQGMQHLGDLKNYKAVFSIFVSRIDVYTEKYIWDLSPDAQGQVGIVNAKKIWRQNEEFWHDKGLKLKPEIVFASTGTKKAEDPPYKYVVAFAGSDIETNPPDTNALTEQSGIKINQQINKMPPQYIVEEINRKVDPGRMEAILMEEGLVKFAKPQKDLLRLIRQGDLLK